MQLFQSSQLVADFENFDGLSTVLCLSVCPHFSIGTLPNRDCRLIRDLSSLCARGRKRQAPCVPMGRRKGVGSVTVASIYEGLRFMIRRALVLSRSM